jgi:hypothetical protein
MFCHIGDTKVIEAFESAKGQLSLHPFEPPRYRACVGSQVSVSHSCFSSSR